MSEVVKRDLGWLTLPASDVNFTAAVERSNEATLRAALEKYAGSEGNKTRETAVKRQLKKLLAEQLEATKGANTRQEMGLALEMTPLVEEREQQKLQAAEQVDRESRIAQTYEIAGRIQAFTFMGKVLTVGVLIQLKQIKELKSYRDLPNVGTWDKYCQYLGFSRQKVDEDLQNLATFGEEFLQTVGGFGLGYRDMKKLRQLTHDGTVTIDADCITIGDETIPINPDHADELQTAIEQIITQKNEIAERNKKLEKDFSGAVKEEVKGYHSKEKALLKEVERLKAFDPEEKDREWSVEQMAAIETATIEYVNLIQKFIIDPRFDEDRHLQARVSGHLQNAEMALYDQRQRLNDVINMFND